MFIFSPVRLIVFIIVMLCFNSFSSLYILPYYGNPQNFLEEDHWKVWSGPNCSWQDRQTDTKVDCLYVYAVLLLFIVMQLLV